MKKEQTNTQKVIKGISSQTLVTIVLGVVEILSFSIMSRLLNKEDFGYYAAITAITSIFSAFSETGIGSAIIQRKDLTKRFIDNAFTINLIFGSFLSLLLFALSGPLARMVVDSSMKVPLMLMSGTLLCHCLTSVNTAQMKRQLQFLKVGLISLIAQVITVTIAIVLAIKGYGYYAIIAKAILNDILVLIMSHIIVHAHYNLALDRETFKKIFNFSGWLMASTLFRNLAHRIDRLLLPRLISVNALGAYNRPKEFVENISTRLNGIFDTALFPVLSGIQDEKNRLAVAFRRSFYYMNIFALLLTLTFIFNSELLIRIFFGEEWLDLNNLMMVISATLLFNIDGRLADCYLRSLAMTKQQFFFRVAEMVIASLSVIVGFRWGVMGVALSAFITNMFVKLFKVNYIAKKIGISVLDSFAILFSSWRFSIFVGPPMLLVILLTDHSFMGNCFVLIVFVILCVLTFLVFPQCVGNQYKEEAYSQILSFIKMKVFKR
jgi:PST family polysaccharide transporter